MASISDSALLSFHSMASGLALFYWMAVRFYKDLPRKKDSVLKSTIHLSTTCGQQEDQKESWLVQLLNLCQRITLFYEQTLNPMVSVVYDI